MTGGFGDRNVPDAHLGVAPGVIHFSRTGDHRAWLSNAWCSSKHSVHSGFPGNCSFPPHGSWWEWVDGTTELESCRAPGEPAPALRPCPIPHTCGGTGRAVAPLPPGALPLLEAVELQAHSQRQVQQGHQPQQLVAGANARLGPLRVGGGHGAVRDPGDSHMVRGREALSSPRARPSGGIKPSLPLPRDGQECLVGPALSNEDGEGSLQVTGCKQGIVGRGLLGTKPHRKGTSKEA